MTHEEAIAKAKVIFDQLKMLGDKLDVMLSVMHWTSTGPDDCQWGPQRERTSLMDIECGTNGDFMAMLHALANPNA